MTFNFFKYQATGNDFIVIDNRQKQFVKNDTKLFAKLCDRRFGIGADGLILLENTSDFDFKMIYFNADGRESTMCGNGGRSIVHFANFLGIINQKTRFLAIDGAHEATIENQQVALKMCDVLKVNHIDSVVVLNTGSPHYVTFLKDIDKLNVADEGAKIRYSPNYIEEGINVNFVEQVDTELFAIRTYERGVEGETLSCGTGATAAAIALYATHRTNSRRIKLLTKGGHLEVKFENTNGNFTDIWLTGPAQKVFHGTYTTTKKI